MMMIKTAAPTTQTQGSPYHIVSVLVTLVLDLVTELEDELSWARATILIKLSIKDAKTLLQTDTFVNWFIGLIVWLVLTDKQALK
jgi:hypothetical protein